MNKPPLLNDAATLQVPVRFSCTDEPVLSLMSQALRHRNGNLPQAYADLVSALMVFCILNDREIIEATSHMVHLEKPFRQKIDQDRDGLAASIGLFKTTRQ